MQSVPTTTNVVGPIDFSVIKKSQGKKISVSANIFERNKAKGTCTFVGIEAKCFIC